MELLLQAWIFDRKFLLGLPYFSKWVIEYCLLLPALISSACVALTIFQCVQIGRNVQEMVKAHVYYYFLASTSVVLCAALVVAQKLCRPRMSIMRNKGQEKSEWILEHIYTRVDFFWLRRQFTHWFLGITSLIVFFCFTMWAYRYLNALEVDIEWRFTRPGKTMEIHAYIVWVGFITALLSMTGCYVFKVIFNLFHLACPRVGQSLCFWRRRRIYKECQELCTKHDFILLKSY